MIPHQCSWLLRVRRVRLCICLLILIFLAFILRFMIGRFGDDRAVDGVQYSDGRLAARPFYKVFKANFHKASVSDKWEGPGQRAVYEGLEVTNSSHRGSSKQSKFSKKGDRRPGYDDDGRSSLVSHVLPDNGLVVETPPSGGLTGLCYECHAFYYPWYGIVQTDGQFLHWNHEFLPHWNPEIRKMYNTGRHSPPDDIASNFYPEIGVYSSRDPAVIRKHMLQLTEAAVGVIAVSYYPPGISDDNGRDWQSIFPVLLRIAEEHNVKVAFHIEPYRNRSELSVRNDLIYIVNTYSKYPAFYKVVLRGRSMPLVYVYDSYLTQPQQWSSVLLPEGKDTIRNTKFDAVVIGLVVDQHHIHDISRGGFDGFYTYFASNGFTYGSSRLVWKQLQTYANTHQLIFIPSVGPGYIDTQVRPWNGGTTRHRANGKYYEESWQAALDVFPKFVSITSFNEWHEGTQIEKAVPKRTGLFTYLDYAPHASNFYLQLTRKFISLYVKPL